MLLARARRHRLCPFAEFLEARVVLEGSPLITEFMASNQESVLDGDRIDSDWIELYNEGDESVDLSGWHLTDRRTDLDRWALPQVELAPDEFVTVFASGQERPYQDAAGNWHTNFKLDADGEYLALVNPSGVVHHDFGTEYPRQRTNWSYGLSMESTQVELLGDPTLYLLDATAPSDKTPPDRWSSADFVVDEAWRSLDDEGDPLAMPLGFDTGSAPASLVAAWNFDSTETKQPDVRHAHTLSLPTSGVTFGQDGPHQETLRFNGTSLAEVEWHSDFSTTSFGFAVWVRPTTRDAQTVLSNQDEPSNGHTFGYQLHIEQGRWAFTTGDGTAPWQTLRGPSVRVDQWNHIAITYDAATKLKQLYVNGTRSVSAEASYAPNTTAGLVIGGAQQIPSLMGSVANLTFFNAATTDELVRQIMDVPITRSATGELNDIIASDIVSLKSASTTYFVRAEFTIDPSASFDQLWLDIQADDGLIVYLNDIRIAERFAPLDTAAPLLATQSTPTPTETLRFDVTKYKSHLQSDNVLAIQLFSAEVDDEDLLLNASLVAENHVVRTDQAGYFTTPSPGTSNLGSPYASLTLQQVTFANPQNTFRAAIDVELQAGGQPIYYTTDGTLPNIDSERYTDAIRLTRTTQIRARVIQPLVAPGPVATRTFLRLSDGLTDFESQLPVVIIDNLGGGAIPNSGWNQTNAGIQQVARQPATLTVFDSRDDVPNHATAQLEESPSTHVRMGIRVRGAFSSSFPQPGYSVEVWNDEYNTDEDVSILGMPAAADWVFYAPNPTYDRTLIDNSFMFELSNQVGHWAPRVRYVEIFLNTDGDDVELSDHVGLFAIVEKVERADGRLDFEELSRDGTDGGWLLEINRMDSIAEDGTPPKNFHTAGPDGIQSTANDLIVGSGRGDDIPRQYNAYINFDDPNGYELTTWQRTAIEAWFGQMEDVLYGRTDVTWNDPIHGYPKYIDVDNFIDYMHFNNLAHNGDGLLLSMWLYNAAPNDGGKLRFGPIWDVDLGGFEGSASAELIRRTDRLWYGRLFEDPDFEQRFTDRWFELREDIFADDNLVNIIQRYRAQIGDAAAVRDGVGDWFARLDQMKNWVTLRAERMASRFPDRPAFFPLSGEVDLGSIIQTDVNRGTVYYTLDGTDPRLPGGEISPSAIAVTVASPLVASESLQIFARTKQSDRWSAPIETTFIGIKNLDNPDLNFDGQVDAFDVQTMYQAIIDRDPQYDLTGDEQTDRADLQRLLDLGWSTTLGDTNLDGRFDSTDLVQIFITGRYETGTQAGYGEGDWNCDGRFDSSDLVIAFSIGLYLAD